MDPRGLQGGRSSERCDMAKLFAHRIVFIDFDGLLWYCWAGLKLDECPCPGKSSRLVTSPPVSLRPVPSCSVPSCPVLSWRRQLGAVLREAAACIRQAAASQAAWRGHSAGTKGIQMDSKGNPKILKGFLGIPKGFLGSSKGFQRIAMALQNDLKVIPKGF